MEAKREEEWVAQFTRRLRRQWRTLDLQSLEEVAREMWHDESLRAQQAEQAATAGKAVYDTFTGISWVLNANLPAFDKFGVTGTTTITSTDKNSNGNTVTVPLVDQDGAVLLTSADPMKKCHSVPTNGLTTEWITALNADVYAGTNTWELPCVDELNKLHKDLGLTAGDRRLEWPFDVGPFRRLQPGFYWACMRAASATDSSGPCDLNQSAPSGLEWSFNFDDGFEGTDALTRVRLI